ncbi:alpha/beta fold hydrolase [Nocardia uniformis]|uniref:Alpha/beta fold hydrolase n=1 Tax=Nocardia uniformis TaxID=53432 RepID=A0A849C9T5_9NOCA|nr:alpha/beta fold hydrolase [Nocardia uniformis]NNH71629.1 alpha/beta fold hydrolase [Nocardia uniformis]
MMPIESATATAQPVVSGGVVVPVAQGPVQDDHLGASKYLKDHPDAAPQGANDFGCTPSAERPRPVVLAHGTDSSAYSDWAAVSPMLARAGFCVFAPNYGGAPGADTYGTEDIYASSAQFGAFVDRVLTATGAQQVDLVGFSQGANVTRYYVNKLGGAPKVGHWVGLASPSYGGIMYGIVPVAKYMPALYTLFEFGTSVAAVQQAAGSPYIQALNAGGDTVPGVRYTTISSRVDEMIQPFENMALRGSGATNLVIQDACSDNLTGHFHQVYEPLVHQLLLNTLDPQRARTPVCESVALGTGVTEVILAAHS